MTEQTFRRLLFAYPKSYRRRHGAEILTTLMEAAGSERRRPTAAEARDLLAGGLRQRFRLPVGRLMVVAAVLVALTAGAFGAALGSFAGWATATPLPDDAGMRGLAALTVGETRQVELSRLSGPLDWRSASAFARPEVTGWTPEAAAARLTAAGWHLDPYRTERTTGQHYQADPGGVWKTVPTEVTQIVAVRGGLLLNLHGEKVIGGPAELDGDTSVISQVEPARPAVTLPLTVAGAVLGLLAGWLRAARAGYRLRRLSLPRRLPAMVAAATAVAILTPLTVSIYNLGARELTAAAAGPDPVGAERFGVPLFIWYASPNAYLGGLPAGAGWIAAAGLPVALLAVVLAFAVRPAASPAPAPTAA
jgi:hypothetical protein